MRKYFLILICFGLAVGSFTPSILLAQEIVKEKINAQILPTIWYSSLNVAEGDRVKIYAGIQNNSGVDFSGSVIFYADDVEIGKVPFSSPSDFLKEVSVIWQASAGKHTFRATVSTDLPLSKELISYESDKTSLDISHELTLEEAKEQAGEIIDTVTEKVDELTSIFADKLESTKKPILSREISGEVLGTATENILPASVYNTGIDIANNLIRNWMWTLSGLAILGLFWTFRS